MSLECIAWGTLLPGLMNHDDCPVVLWRASDAAVEVVVPLPAVCPCECRTCKRAWWDDGRPRVVSGKIERSATR